MKCLRCGKEIRKVKCPGCGFECLDNEYITIFPLNWVEQQEMNRFAECRRQEIHEDEPENENVEDKWDDTGYFVIKELKKSVTILGYKGQRDGLKRLVVPAKINEKPVRKIGYRAFSGLQTVVEIVIPEGVNKIETFAFCECRNLEKIELPESVTEIEQGAVWKCESLQELKLPFGWSVIGNLNTEPIIYYKGY